MNIFYLHEDPEVCASMHIWPKHTVKMILETAQMLCTAHRLLDGQEIEGISKGGRRVKRYILADAELNEIMYGTTHINHPSCVWLRADGFNYAYAYELMMALGEEFLVRSKKKTEHLTITKLGEILKTPPKNIEFKQFTPPTPAMPDEFKVEGDSLASYRGYYDYKRKVIK